MEYDTKKIKDLRLHPIIEEHYTIQNGKETYTPFQTYSALATHVLTAAQTRCEGAWAAYIDATEGIDHRSEYQIVLQHGVKLDEKIARSIFPMFNNLPYAR